MGLRPPHSGGCSQRFRGLGLPYVDLTTDVDNVASQKVITSNGGVLVERFTKPAAYGPDSPALRWRIRLLGEDE